MVSRKLPLRQTALTPEKHRLAVYVLFIFITNAVPISSFAGHL